MPGTAGSEVDAILKDAALIDQWQEPTTDHRLMVRVLARAEQCEDVLDAFEQRFGRDQHFRAAILEVQAVLPRLEEPEPETEPVPEPESSREPA